VFEYRLSGIDKLVFFCVEVLSKMEALLLALFPEQAIKKCSVNITKHKMRMIYPCFKVNTV
jgi:hypothetical protein